MRNVKNMFDPEYQGLGPLSLSQLQEGEREKQRKLRRYLADKKRAEKVAEINKDVPQLTDDMVSEASPNMVEQRPETTAPEPKSGMNRYMPYKSPSQPEPEANIPMAPTEPEVPYERGFGNRSLVGQRYGLGIDNEGQLPYQSPSRIDGYGLMNPDPQAARTEDYKLDLPDMKRQDVRSEQDAGPLISTPQNSRDMLYKYLEDRRKSEPEFQRVYQDRTNDAETGRVLNTFVSGLGEMASMAGTLQGKRSDPGDMKSLPAAIYGAQKNKADELLALRQLSNREQRGDIQMLRDLERGDLDNLRMQKILQDMRKQRQQPKTLPYFVPGDDNTPPRMVMMDADGKLVYQDLPPGARPTNETFMAGAPLYTQAGEVVIPSTQKSTGKTTFTPAPSGTRTGEQIRISNQEEYNNARLEFEKAKSEMQNANAEQRIDLQNKMYELRKAMDEFNKGMENRKQDFKEEQGSQEKVKKLSAKDIAGLSEAKNSQNIINDLLGTIDKYKDIMGPVEGTLRSSKLIKPFDERSKLFDSDIRRIRQVIGKLTEGGVLRKEDEYKYLEMLPNMSDTPKVARYKAQQFGTMLKRDYDNHVKMLRDQGYDTTGLGGESGSSRKPLNQMTREEKLRELEEHKARGR